MAKNPTDGAVNPAPVTQAYVPPAPRLKIERQGQRAEPYSERLPQVRGGICEFCGVIDRNVPSEHQYKLCGHFRDIGQLRCSYCDETKNPDDVVGHSVMNNAKHPDNPTVLISWCDSYNCSKAHEQRFKRNQS
jgi:hypothetical protein